MKWRKRLNRNDRGCFNCARWNVVCSHSSFLEVCFENSRENSKWCPIGTAFITQEVEEESIMKTKGVTLASRGSELI